MTTPSELNNSPSTEIITNAVPADELNRLALMIATEDTSTIATLMFSSYLVSLKQVPWKKIKYLCIIGDGSNQVNSAIRNSHTKPGAYLNKDEDWLMLLYLKDEKIQPCLNKLRTNLTSLIISHTEIERISLQSLASLTSLYITNCPNLEYVNDLDDCGLLTTLTLYKCSHLRSLPDFERLTQLTKLTLYSCPELLTIDFPQNNNLVSVSFSRCDNLRSLSGFSSSQHLKTLSISFCYRLAELNLQKCTALTSLNLSKCENISIINLSGCISLVTLWEISDIKNLNTLNLHGCVSLSMPSGLNRLEKLRRLDVTGLICPMKLNLSGCSSLTELFGLGTLTQLAELDLSHCINLTSLPGLEKLIQLTTLNLSRCQKLSALPSLVMLKKLAKIDLSYSAITRVSKYICTMKSLRILNLSGMHLVECPSFFPDIATTFCTSEFDFEVNVMFDDLFGTSNAKYMYIGLFNTTIEGVDMSIFEQPYEIVVKWFENRRLGKTQPLNEIKVVFLGDGEAGKTHTIARLLNEGKALQDFDGQATPGIAITDRTYNIDGRQIEVHFWDFGGQEILHSMHRMFLTNRTLYVVLLNARDDKQDEQARYWLHNIKSFAPDAPVLLVVNKLDQNPNASINEIGMRKLYPRLTEVVRMSALSFTQEEFNATFTSALKRQIAAIKVLESPFTSAWRQLKDMLHNMTEHYIKSDKYAEFCQECGVEESETIRKGLLDWFKDLGVSFCYSESQKLEDYVVLQPQWITNAIYILLFNRIEGNKNGMIAHEDIFRMLKQPNALADTIHRVMPDVYYTSDEVQYVLNVVRQFRLSYPVDGTKEFFPMLCDRNETEIVKDYADQQDVLEFRMIYEYLPPNVLHRLMVDMHRDLQTSNVWLTGAHFIQGYSGLSAVIKSDGNILTIYVRRGREYPAKVYLDTIKDHLERISKDMGLEITERLVVYNSDGIAEAFNYQMLLGMINKGCDEVYSMIRDKMIPISDILRQTDHEVDSDRQKLTQDILRICRKMQQNKMYWDASENDRNTYIRDALENMGYIAKDQTLAGVSAGGKLAGELDIEIQRPTKDTMTILEGLKLSGTSDSREEYWDKHLKKLLDNYNAMGLPFLIMVSYIPCAKNKFKDISSHFSNRAKNYSPEGYHIREAIQQKTAPDRLEETNFLQMMKCLYDCGGAMTTVYHIFVRLGDE